MRTPFDATLERTEAADEVYGALGRALYLAADFEQSCAALAAMVGVKFSASELESPAAMTALAEKLWRRKLHQHITAIAFLAGPKRGIFRVLDSGRRARNELIHSLTIGIKHPLTGQMPERFVTKELQPLIERLAEAQLLVLVLASILSHEPIPTPTFLLGYPDRLVAWVCASSL